MQTFPYPMGKIIRGAAVVNERCTCGCVMTVHRAHRGVPGHGACTLCACPQFRWQSFVFTCFVEEGTR